MYEYMFHLTSSKRTRIPGKGIVYTVILGNDPEFKIKDIIKTNIMIDNRSGFVEDYEFVGCHRPFRNNSSVNLTVLHL